MSTGSIILFKEDKGYGFIRPKGSKDSNDNVYLHVSALQASGIHTIKQGQRLTYDLSTENGKNSAINITLLN